jgi:hypothetical protein
MTCSFSDDEIEDPTITCDNNGTAELTLTANDGVNDPVSDTAPLTVSNVDPVITSFTGPSDPVAVDTEVLVSGAFTDAGANDTHSATIDWGDDTVTGPDAVSGGSVTGTHAYSAAGIYTVTLTVTDDDGGSDTETYMYVVVYDPSAGFVTGGGWIWSPEGAYVDDPGLEGRANFGFVAKYKKGQTIPDGQTQFQFQAGGLNFHSTSYQWLVVSGAKATYKGWGTINGSGDYRFLLSAIDGQLSGGGDVDRFRIKIWDEATDVIVYDNTLVEGGDDADPAAALRGGSIVIHSGAKK